MTERKTERGGSETESGVEREEKGSAAKGYRWGRRRPLDAIFEFEDSYGAHTALRKTSGSETVSDGATGPNAEGGEMAAEPVDVEALFEQAKAAANAGSLADAMRTYRRVVAADPSHLRARNNLGVLLDRSGEHDVAAEHFRAALELAPENAEILTNLGAALASSGRFDQAESMLRRAARLDPGGLDVRANLGILFFRKGLYAQAEHELRWVCEQDPEHALALFYRGEALNRLGRIDEALETLEKSARLEPDRARIYYLLGILYDKKNLRQEAAVMYRKARELNEL